MEKAKEEFQKMTREQIQRLSKEEFRKLAISQVEFFPDLLEICDTSSVVDYFYEFYNRKREEQ